MILKQLPLVLLSFYSIFCANFAYASINDTCFNGGIVTNAKFTNNVCTFSYTDATGLTFADQCNEDWNLNATTCTNENVLLDIKQVGSVNNFQFASIINQGTIMLCTALVNGVDISIGSNTVVGALPSNAADWTFNTDRYYCDSSVESCMFSYSNSSNK